MNRLFFTLIFTIYTSCLFAQSDSTTFRTQLYNDEYDVQMVIDLYDANVNIPHMDLFGPQLGYLKKPSSTNYCWIVAESTLKNNKSAELVIINESGSEDLTATLTLNADSTYTLKQESGSRLKVPKGSKWFKLPTTIPLKPKK